MRMSSKVKKFVVTATLVAIVASIGGIVLRGGGVRPQRPEDAAARQAAENAAKAEAAGLTVMTIDEASRVLNIVITFPTTVALMHGLWGWASQYIFQQGAYKAFIVSSEIQGTGTRDMESGAQRVQRKT